MLRYLTTFILLLACLLLLVSCTKQLKGTEVHVPEVKINDTLIELETQTICWGTEECLDVIGESGSEFSIDNVATKNYFSKIGEELAITFHDTPKPSTINVRIEEKPEYHGQWSYNGDTIKVDLPTEPGTYTYNILVYWHGKKALTEGLSSYQFLITVE